MKHPDKIVVKHLTYGECLNKDRLVLIKYIIAKMADLNPFPPKCSEPLKSEIYDKIEEKLSHSYKYELIDILKSENELRMICSDVKNGMMKELINSFNDDDIESDTESVSVSDISDISDIESDDGIKIDNHDVSNFMRELTRGRNSAVKIKFGENI